LNQKTKRFFRIFLSVAVIGAIEAAIYLLGSRLPQSVLTWVSCTGEIVMCYVLVRIFCLRNSSTPAGCGFIRPSGIIGGFLLGALAISATIAAMAFFGGTKLAYQGFHWDLITVFAYFFVVALFEETLCRGLVQSSFYITHGFVPSVLITNTFFSLLHFLNPSFGLLAALNIFAAGLVFSALMAKTGSIWPAIGFHWSWNYLQGMIYGVPVSGLVRFTSLYTAANEADNVINGGSFGAEGGLACSLALCACLAFIIFILPHRENPEQLRLRAEYLEKKATKSANQNQGEE